jgi:hypothetical protein
MLMKINDVEIAAYPEKFTVTPLDIDNGESTVRTADGVLQRDRIAVKRQIEMSWGPIEWSKISALLQSMSGVFFDFYYPDPMDGNYATKTFYVGNRPCPVLFQQGEKILWSGLKVTLTER